VGPDLSEIGAYRRYSELTRSIVDPDAEILPSNRTVYAVKNSGTTIVGRLLNQDTFSIQLITSDEQLMNLSKSELRKWDFAANSPMPSYRGKLNSQELADLTNYLVSLKGRRNKP
jgi:putative heme-binding domain-containing protein